MSAAEFHKRRSLRNKTIPEDPPLSQTSSEETRGYVIREGVSDIFNSTEGVV